MEDRLDIVSGCDTKDVRLESVVYVYRTLQTEM